MRNLLNLLIFMDMRYIYYLFSLCLGLSLLACGDDEKEEDIPLVGPAIEKSFLVRLQDGEGQNVISSGAYDPDSLYVRYMVDGELRRGYGPGFELVNKNGYSDISKGEEAYLRVSVATNECGMPPYFDPLRYDVTEAVSDEGELYLVYGAEERRFGPIQFTIGVWLNEYNDVRAITRLSYEDQTIEGTNGVILVTVP